MRPRAGCRGAAQPRGWPLRVGLLGAPSTLSAPSHLRSSCEGLDDPTGGSEWPGYLWASSTPELCGSVIALRASGQFVLQVRSVGLLELTSQSEATRNCGPTQRFIREKGIAHVTPPLKNVTFPSECLWLLVAIHPANIHRVRRLKILEFFPVATLVSRTLQCILIFHEGLQLSFF